MKKQFLITLLLSLLATTGMAQKFLDFYRGGKIVSSIAVSGIDKAQYEGYADKRSIDFYHNGENFHHALVSSIDSIKVFDEGKPPLVYLCIVGFNQELYEKPFGVLANSTEKQFRQFVNGLSRKDGTLLYYAVDHALDMLKKETFVTPLTSVNLITFTDGLDQGSLMMNSSYGTDEQYLNAVSNRIKNTTVNGLPLTAYSLGLRGSDVSDYDLFQRNLTRLASAQDKAFEVSSMSAVQSRLQDISNQIISISNKQTISLKIPGQSNGTKIRFTFDGGSATNSDLYIEGTFNLSDRSLRNITYRGLKAESGTTVQGKQDGIFVTFTFTGLQRRDGNGLIPTNNIRQYYQSANTTTWQRNSEFTPGNNTQTTITHSGAVILLVLDCSSSLGKQFSSMQSYANNFISDVADNAAPYDNSRPFGNRPKGSVEVYVVNGVEFSMVKVEGGTFQMGSPDDDSDAFSDERPQHQVTLSDYYIGETEVTQKLWRVVMGSNPSHFVAGYPQRPVELVSRNDCLEFIEKLNALTGKKFRLPTEAEWEFAARGGNKSKGYKYSGSDDIDDVAWYRNNSRDETHDVATKAPNELGLYDMSGNVWEWCQDWYGSYSSEAQTNPTGPSSGSYRVIRGGSWYYNARICRVSDRGNGTSSYRNYDLGLRLAL